MATLYSLDVSTGDHAQPCVSGDRNGSLNRLANFLQQVNGGHSVTSTTLTVRNTAVAASGTVTISSGSGTITATINGVAIQVTWATSDTASAADLAAQINASTNALVQYLVTATSAAGVVTVTAVVPGKSGNCITLAASGTGATASGARLTSGSESRFTLAF